MRSKQIGDYVIYENGQIISYAKSNEGMLLKPHLNNNGYYTVELHGKEYRLHKLLAECFIHNPDNKPMVNHKDGIKTNIALDNLEWSTSKENVQHAYDNNLCPRNKGPRVDNRIVIQKDLDGNEVNRFNSLTEAAKSVTTNYLSACSKIHQVCIGYTYNGYTRKTAYKFKWSYAN